MKRITRILSLAIALVLSLQMLSVSAQSSVEVNVMKEYDMLISAGILDENNDLSSQNGNVSRAGLVKVAIDICMGPDVAINEISGNPYNDVKENDAYYNEILLANKIGLISTVDKFRPNDDVTYLEAIKILIGALGYHYEAERCGGFPEGYIMVAKRVGLTQGITIKHNEALDFSTFYKLIYHAIKCDITDVYAVTGSGNSLTVSYAPVEGKNLLNAVFDIYEEEGIVTANKYATLTGVSTSKRDIIKIDKEQYYINDKVDVVGTLGYYVNVLYHYDKQTKDKTVIYLEVDERENSTIVINADNRVDGSNKSAIYYMKNDRREGAKVSRTAAMIYNNGWVKFNETYLYPDNGTVTLIDNNGDETIDVVKVMNYETFIVGSVISENGTITNAFGGANIVLDETDDDYDFVLLKNGKKLDINNISQYNIVSYAESTSGKIKLKTVIASSAYVKGRADGYVGNKVVIGGNAYRMTDYMKKNMKLGTDGVFYLDSFNQVAFQEAENGIIFGYFNNIMKETKMGDDVVTLQIFSEHGRFAEVKLADKISFNGSTKTATEFYNSVSADLASNRQLVEYKVNRNNLITLINFAETVTLGTDEEKTARENGKFRLSKTLSSATYRNGGFNDLMKFGSQTKIFFVPDQSSGSADLSDFYISSLTNEANYQNIKAYNMDCYLTPEILVITESASTKRYNSGITIFDGTKQMIGKNDEVVTAIECWQGGVLYTYPVLDDSGVLAEINSLEKGDAGRIAFNHQGEVKGFQLWFDKSAGFDPRATGSVWGTSEAYAVADVIEIDHQNKKMVLNYDGYRVGTYTTPAVYIYDLTQDRIFVGDIYDIQKGSKIFTTTGYLSLGTMIVFVD